MVNSPSMSNTHSIDTGQSGQYIWTIQVNTCGELPVGKSRYQLCLLEQLIHGASICSKLTKTLEHSVMLKGICPLNSFSETLTPSHKT